MKKIITLALLSLAASTAVAQTMYDAINYTDNTYYGTARSAALGNAMTAIGGDLGSIGINPAGSAVAGYSQFTITPGLSIASTTSSYAPVAYGAVAGTMPDSQTRFIMPNFGFVLNMDTHQMYGLKNFTLGMTLNSTGVYNERMSAGGTNSNSSMMGEMAYFATGMSGTYAGAKNAYYDTQYPWTDILAFQSGMISTYGEGDDQYIGSSEVIFDDGTIGLGGPIKQSFYRQRRGSKSDALINMGFNWNDRFYLGANIGVVSLTFNESTNKLETPVNKGDFALILDDVDTYWLRAQQRYSLETEGSGIYAKLGVIWLPVEGLRLGAAIKTPTVFAISERWMWDATCDFDGFNSETHETPVGEYTYRIISPFNFNLGAAYTLGNRALVSVDWERTDFRSMRFSEADRYYEGSFSEDNAYIRQNAGATDYLRAGVELRATDEFALRAGYAFKRYAEKAANTRDLTHTASLGFGYSSPGSFFLDAAVRYSMLPDNWYYPYDDYLATRSPEICVTPRQMDVILTLGWRF